MTTAIFILLILLLVGVIAGFVDTLAGGGGMLTIPALLMTGIPPDAALATNKLQGTVGSASASFYFIRKGHLRWHEIYQGFIASCLGSCLGAIAIQIIDSSLLAKIIPVILMLIAILLLCIPQMGQINTKQKMSSLGFAIGFAFPIGFYDGFLGPGTGTFFMLALISIRGFTITEATIRAKIFNMASNVVALVIFIISGKIVWTYGFSMAIGQMIGAGLASKMIISTGHKIIRPIVITMSIIMSLVLVYRYWLD